MVSRRHALLALALATGACGTAPARESKDPRVGSEDTAKHSPRRDVGPARWFHASTEQGFWVTHEPELDRIVANGTRLEVGPEGRIRVAAPSEATLLGSLAVADHLGGGFVHWSRRRVFRSREFVGALEPVALPERNERALLGARNGLSQVLVLTDAEAYALAPDGDVTPPPYPAMADFAALDARRGLTLDVFGRTRMTSDGGATWRDVTPDLGLSPSAIGVTEDGIWVQTPMGQYELSGEPLGMPEPIVPVNERYQPGEVRYRSIRRILDVRPRWSRSNETLLMSAIRGGVLLPDGTALGQSSQEMGRVNLQTGETVEELSDPLHNGLSCRPFSVDDGVLLACRWEQYQYYGAYVLWSQDGARPRIEKAFSDDGLFIGTDDGALAYTGSCTATPRFVEGGRFHHGDESLSNTICVRRGPGAWAERHLPDAAIDRWVPSTDGTAVALVRARDASLTGLVPRVGAPPAMSVKGVRTLHVPTLDDDHELMSVGAADETAIEQSFAVQPDGTVSGWALRSRDDRDVHVGVEITPLGRVTLFEPPPDAAQTVVTGPWGLARSRQGRLFETRDRGRTWAAVEDSPVGADAFSGSCSQLGCVLSTLVRVGWGPAPLRVFPPSEEEEPDEPKMEASGRVALRCTPQGSPSLVPPVRGPLAEPVNARRGVTMATGYGDTLRLVQLADEEPEPDDDAKPTDGDAAPVTGIVTHALVWTPPFALEAPPSALGAVLPDVRRIRNPMTIPLLDAEGRVALLVMHEKDEILVRPDSVEVWPAYEEGRGYWGRLAATGGLLAEAHADVVLVVSQLPTLERHGPAPSAVPRFFGLERNMMIGRHLSLVKSPDGGRALLSLNRPHPDPVGVAAIRSHGDLAAVQHLASWRDALPADDPRCSAEKDAYRGVLVIDPAAWFAIDEVEFPGVRLGHQGLLLARWGQERVCVEAVRLSVSADRHDMNVAAIVGRFGRRGAGAVLRSEGVVHPLTCRLGEDAP